MILVYKGDSPYTAKLNYGGKMRFDPGVPTWVPKNAALSWADGPAKGVNPEKYPGLLDDPNFEEWDGEGGAPGRPILIKMFLNEEYIYPALTALARLRAMYPTTPMTVLTKKHYWPLLPPYCTGIESIRVGAQREFSQTINLDPKNHPDIFNSNKRIAGQGLEKLFALAVGWYAENQEDPFIDPDTIQRFDDPGFAKVIKHAKIKRDETGKITKVISPGKAERTPGTPKLTVYNMNVVQKYDWMTVNPEKLVIVQGRGGGAWGEMFDYLRKKHKSALIIENKTPFDVMFRHLKHAAHVVVCGNSPLIAAAVHMGLRVFAFMPSEAVLMIHNYSKYSTFKYAGVDKNADLKQIYSKLKQLLGEVMTDEHTGQTQETRTTERREQKTIETDRGSASTDESGGDSARMDDGTTGRRNSGNRFGWKRSAEVRPEDGNEDS